MNLAGNRLVRFSSATKLLIIALLFITALGIRLYHVNEPPLDFHATRQYRSLIIARGYFFDSSDAVPEWQKQVARVSQQKQGMLEPPIMELVVSAGYRVLGGEYIWLPRLLSSLFWLTGGGFLYLTARNLSGYHPALLGTAFYLFLPFGVIASRSFQPDPLMVMLLMASLFAILRYHEAPSKSRLAIAAVISAPAFVVKPGVLFPMAGSFLLPAVLRRGFRQALLGQPTLFLFASMLLPAALIYLGGLLTGTLLLGEMQKTLLPELWLTEFFWRGWLDNIRHTVGIIPTIVGLLGVLIVPKGLHKALLAGLWVGYAMFGIALNYNVATHDYYQLQLIPIVGLSSGPALVLVISRLEKVIPKIHWRRAACVAILPAVFLAIGLAAPSLNHPEAQAKAKVKEEIGEQVGHSTRTIFLSSDYGVPLEYHGLLSGWPWPISSDLQWEQLAGLPVLSAEDRFQSHFSNYVPDYFIVEDLHELDEQPDLKGFLSGFPLVYDQNNTLIFDLTAR